MQGLNSWNCEIMTWAQIKGQTLNWLSHPGAIVGRFNIASEETEESQVDLFKKLVLNFLIKIF